MKTILPLAVIFTATLLPAEAAAQSKEDLLSGTPLNPQIVVDRLQQPQVSLAMAQCGAGKISAGTATMHVSVDASGAASLTKVDPVLPPDVTGCLGGIISSLDLPPSGSGTDVTFLFTFPATAPGAATTQPPPQHPPEYYSGKRMRRAGIGLIIPGAIFVGIGGLVFLMSFVAPDLEDDPNGPRYTGLGLALFGGLFLVPGIVLAAVGRKRMEAALKQSASLPVPLLALDPETKSAGLLLSWRF